MTEVSIFWYCYFIFTFHNIKQASIVWFVGLSYFKIKFKINLWDSHRYFLTVNVTRIDSEIFRGETTLITVSTVYPYSAFATFPVYKAI